MNNELISIVIPVYNVEEHLEKCVSSIRNQTYKNLEIILVDDGSTDNSSAICDALAKEDSRIKVIHKENGGVSIARNIGIKTSTGVYIGFVDSDDYIDERMYELLHDAIMLDAAQMSVCNYSWVDSDGIIINTTNVKNNVFTGDFVLKYHLLDNFSIWTPLWNKIYKREILQMVKFPVDKINEDSYVIHEIINNCSTISLIQNNLYKYVQRQGSITDVFRSGIQKKEKFNVKELDAVDAHFNRAKFYLNSDFDNKNALAIKSVLKGLSDYHACYFGVKKEFITKECKEKNKKIQQEYLELISQSKIKNCNSKKDKLLLGFCKISIFYTYRIFDILK